MEVLKELPAKSPPSVVAIGVFDGVHIGHREVLDKAIDRAKEDYLLSVALTFEPHPATLLYPDKVPQLLTSLDNKLALLDEIGIERTLLVDFNSDVASLSPAEFAEKFLVKSLNTNVVVVGEDFRFGCQREGDVDTLRSLGAQHDFVVDAIPLRFQSATASTDGPASTTDGSATEAGMPVSSTTIRSLLAEGRIKEVAPLLGRLYSVEGEVIVGDKRGRTIGFPTANLPVSQQRAWPADGVYAGWFTDEGKVRRPCAINIGRRPTFYQHVEHSILEAHILDFDGDLYGQIVEVEFADYLRSEQRFDGIEQLKEQLTKDVQRCREILAVG